MNNTLQGKKVGFALSGSFCTFERALVLAEILKTQGAELTAILSHNTDTMDTRFMQADALKEALQNLTERPLIRTLNQAEPIGPKKMFDILLVLPATGNTLAKLAHCISDTPVTMAVKSHLRNNRPVVLAVSTNDGLGANAQNIGSLLNMKHIYFVPFHQDDPDQKPKSLVFLERQVVAALEAALDNRQLQPVIDVA